MMAMKLGNDGDVTVSANALAIGRRRQWWTSYSAMVQPPLAGEKMVFMLKGGTAVNLMEYPPSRADNENGSGEGVEAFPDESAHPRRRLGNRRFWREEIGQHQSLQPGA